MTHLNVTPALSPPAKALSLAGAQSALDSAKSRLRGRRAPDEALFVRFLTRYEDWLEYEHPRASLRAGLRRVRRLLEDRAGGR